MIGDKRYTEALDVIDSGSVGVVGERCLMRRSGMATERGVSDK